MDGGKMKDTSDRLKQIYASGFNIYLLINKTKKNLRWSKERNFPPEVLERICEAYWKEKDSIRFPYPWFLSVLQRTSADYFSKREIQEHTKLKNEPTHLKDIMAQILKG